MGVNMTDAEEVKAYLENLFIEYQFSCFKENNGEGCCLLGEFFETVKGDYVKAAKAYKKSCDEFDYARSCFKYGGALHRGRGVKADEEKALKYQTKACDLGWKEGCLAAAFHWSQKPESIAEAVKFFERACAKESENGCDFLSGVYFSGQGSVKKDPEKAFYYAERACTLGHPQACANVSWMYKNGIGVALNLEESARYKAMALDIKQQMEKTRGLDMEQGISS